MKEEEDGEQEDDEVVVVVVAVEVEVEVAEDTSGLLVADTDALLGTAEGMDSSLGTDRCY